MKLCSKLLLLAALLFTLSLSQSSFGQRGGQTITCSSNDGRRNFCAADTSRGVRLSRQISGSACIQGQTWGWDNRGLWVDRGCRAEFVVGGGGGNWGPGGGQGQVVTCSSNDGRRNWCNSFGARPESINLSRQISGSPCVRGDTWGVDQRGLWVDRGCRAEFIVGGGGGNWGPGGGPVQVVTCSSNDGRRNWCNSFGARPESINLSRQISGSACVRGDTWGVDQRGLWVDRGCRAEFTIGGNWGDRPPGQIVTCSSNDGKRNWCGIPPGEVRLSRQISGSPCIEGQTWGRDNRGLWVDRGCRAEFMIR